MEETESKEENLNASAETAKTTKYSEKELKQQVQELEEDNRKQQNEFNTQRAKLKDLFMQKEAEHVKCQEELNVLRRELDEMKSQFLVADLKQQNELHLREMKAQEEISSLQQMVQDTIEESTICKAELLHVKEECKRLWQENMDLREQLQQETTTASSLAPQMLNQVRKTLVRKLGGDSAANVLSDSFDGNRSANVVAAKQPLVQEEPEVLRSIMEQLQEEMKALKQKLRDADEQLQSKQIEVTKLEANTFTNGLVPNNTVVSNCSSCAEQAEKVKELEETARKHAAELDDMQKNVEEATDALEKEAALRKDLENQWQEKREAHKEEVQLLREQVRQHEQQLLALQHKFLEAKEQLSRKLQQLTAERELVNKQLETLQADNDFLSGKYLATAEEIENQSINLPDTVEELQELMLRQRDELIQARVSSEFEKRRCVSSLDEIEILQNQLGASNAERHTIKRQLQNEIKTLQQRLSQHLLTLQDYETTKTSLERKEAELNRQISELRVEIIELKDSNEKLNKANADYKSKIKILQEGLVNAEQVQKDFVKLSQSLQVSLEKLRHADAEVRWQDDEDISTCPTCKILFTVTVRKIHCRHCGQIYCDKCLTKHVPSGPRGRSARVCDICHTLLTPNTAPYFSKEPLSAN